MAGYIGNKAVGINVTTGDILGDVGVGGDFAVDGTTNLDATNIVGATDISGNFTTSPDTAGKDTFSFTSNAANDASMFLKSNTTNKVNIQANGTSFFNGGAVTMALQPAFLARPASQQSNIPINATTTIVFGTEIFDQGADFASNTFTAPVTGKYQLNVQLMIQEMDKGTDFLIFKLVTTNRNYTAYWDNDDMAADSPNGHPINIVVLTDMDASDTALVQVVISNNGTAQMDVTTASAFSGYLVA